MSAPAANQQDVPSILRLSFELTRFVLLRYETEFTPCTGITAVTKQERRSFKNGVMIAPWCPALNRVESGCPLLNGAVIDTGWQFEISTGKACRVLTTQPDGLMPIEFLAMAGHFQGYASPYDVSAEDLSCDSLAFGLAVASLTAPQLPWTNGLGCRLGKRSGSHAAPIPLRYRADHPQHVRPTAGRCLACLWLCV